jgi:ribosome-associated toxin RatA of RatAB toxin-antitoxin module
MSRDPSRAVWEILRGGSTSAADLEELRGGKTEEKDSGKKKLTPYKRGKPGFKADRKIEQVLKEGKVWDSTIVIGRVAHAKAVMDVEAAPKTVWGQLLDFNNYAKKVPKLQSCSIYHRDKGFSSDRIMAKFVNPVGAGIKMVYYIDHTYEASKSSITWTLDDSYKNSFKEVQGHWHVAPHPESSSKARVFYEISTVLPSWFPKWLGKKLTRSAVQDATSWVKRESEASQARMAGGQKTPFR